MPASLLDSASREVQLVETHRLAEVAPYICLSHCWGDPAKQKQFTTTRITLEERKRGIPWKILPRIFQDVIRSVRRIGIRYLWIDSLCIVQDEPLEWKT
jgi:hypothetical protein